MMQAQKLLTSFVRIFTGIHLSNYFGIEGLLAAIDAVTEKEAGALAAGIGKDLVS